MTATCSRSHANMHRSLAMRSKSSLWDSGGWLKPETQVDGARKRNPGDDKRFSSDRLPSLQIIRAQQALYGLKARFAVSDDGGEVEVVPLTCPPRLSRVQARSAQSSRSIACAARVVQRSLVGVKRSRSWLATQYARTGDCAVVIDVFAGVWVASGAKVE